MKNLKNKLSSQETYKAIQDYLPDDHSDPQSINSNVKRYFSQPRGSIKVLDLGCGEGNSADFFQSISTKTDWYGVDIEGSPEVKQRTRENSRISSFNGTDLPYPDSHFDLIYCHQVLEHVRYPDRLIGDALRVLKPNGVFMGSVSYLEPYHSYSIFNFTPYGIARTFGDAGFDLKEIRPSIDASLLINRQLLNKSKALNFVWNHNYIFGICNLIGFLFKLDHRQRNFLKIQFSGHLAFTAARPNKPNQ